MKNVLILGAGGVLGSEITRQLEQQSDVRQICYDIRQISYKRSNGKNICADACDENALRQAVSGVDFVVCSLNGDWLSQAQTLVSVLHGRQDVRIIWVTGMGIHNEVSGIPYTLVRTADLTESGDASYHLHHAGEKAHSRYVSRAAVAALIVKMIQSEDGLGLNESIGITD